MAGFVIGFIALFFIGLFTIFMGVTSSLTKVLFPPPPPSNRTKDLEEAIKLAEETLREAKEYENRHY